MAVTLFYSRNLVEHYPTSDVPMDRLCVQVARVLGYISRGLGVRIRALPDFLRISGSGTGSTQPHEDS
jgi:hypothetical protein